MKELRPAASFSTCCTTRSVVATCVVITLLQENDCILELLWYYNEVSCDRSIPLQCDPLQKAMTAFASALDVPLYKVKFSFDGDDIHPSQTANDVDIENDDVIDARIM